ncbi:hypothetical protein TARUN_5053 [Trichoderma arundinaceum]|uniref:2EXR domain-containing protein n=1 Tax=Trichoderma arundinaceum TaxID=490622 RepID=A0A395NML7_TRIAR|nr:hypothetical protein TARUN_5053 [Trichoderma arundinaceum]
MVVSTFHLFSLLPPEIRYAIYILATPPRVVRLRQQLESFEDFERRLPHITIAERHLPPDVDYSPTREMIRRASAILRRKRRAIFKQTKLESYGFTSNKKARFSWEFENTLPLDIFMTIPTLAFVLYRRATLSSKAAIPPLLHTCRESRSLLVSYGYQLAFPSTSEEPLIWFNFMQDTLLLDHGLECSEQDPYMSVPTEYHRIPYSFHPFRPQDTSRVQRLALKSSVQANRLFLGHRIFQELEELILVEWDARESEQALRQSIVDPAFLRLAPDTTRTNHKGESLCVLPVEEADALWTTFLLDVFRTDEDFTEYLDVDWEDNLADLRQHKLENGFFSNFLDHRVRQKKEDYEREKGRIENWNKQQIREFAPLLDEFPPWNIRRVRYMHACAPHIADRIIENRSVFMEQFARLRTEVTHTENENEDTWIKQRSLPHPFVLQRYNNWPGVDEAFHSLELQWWIKNGLPVVPSQEHILNSDSFRQRASQS